MAALNPPGPALLPSVSRCSFSSQCSCSQAGPCFDKSFPISDWCVSSVPSAAIASEARTREDHRLSFQERALSISLLMDPAAGGEYSLGDDEVVRVLIRGLEILYVDMDFTRRFECG